VAIDTIFRVFLREIHIGVDYKLAHSNVMVILKGGVENNLNYFFNDKNERWFITPNQDLGLKSYKKNTKSRNIIYYLPLDEEMKTLKGNSLYYWCQGTDKREPYEPYICVGRFEVVKGLVVEYIINIDYMKHWKEIHNGVLKEITAMVTNT
jgi:hypothetical protein